MCNNSEVWQSIQYPIYLVMQNTNKVAIISGGAMGYKDGGASIGGAAAIRSPKMVIRL